MRVDLSAHLCGGGVQAGTHDSEQQTGARHGERYHDCDSGSDSDSDRSSGLGIH